MKNAKLKIVAGFCFMTAVTLYATNLSTNDKDKCFGNASQPGRTTCCQDACKAANTAQADIDSCTKDCTDYQG